MAQIIVTITPSDEREQKIFDASFEFWREVYAANCWGKIYDTTISE